MCYSDWSSRAKELERLEKAWKEAEDLARRIMKPRPAGGAAAPRSPEKQPAQKPEPVTG